MIPRAKISEVVRIIAEKYHPEKIILFGSHAYGKPDPGSDLDILLIKNTDLPRYRRSREVRKFLRGLAVPMDILVYTPREVDRWKNIQEAFITRMMRKGKVLYA